MFLMLSIGLDLKAPMHSLMLEFNALSIILRCEWLVDWYRIAP